MKNNILISRAKPPARSFRAFKKNIAEKEHGFTLIEIIIVIIIVGILAAIGLIQYEKTVEKTRRSEAKTIIGTMRSIVMSYYLENGTASTMGNNDVNIGTASDQIPSACRSSHYFYYSAGFSTGTYATLQAHRCTGSGKSPQGSSAYSLADDFYYITGIDRFYYREQGGIWVEQKW